MKFPYTFAFLAAVALPASPLIAQDSAEAQGPVEFEVAGETFVIDPPEGYCAPSGLSLEVSRQYAALDSQNLTPVDLQKCGTFGEDYILIKTPRAMPPMPLPRETFVSLIAAELQKQNVVDDGFASGARDIKEGTGGQIDIAPQQIGYAGSDEACAYMSGTVLVSAGATSAPVRVGSCASIVGTRHLVVHSYDFAEGGASTDELLARSRDVLLAISKK